MRTRTVLLALVLACVPVAARPLRADGPAASPKAAQQAPFPLTEKLKNLEGTWVRDPARGAGGICGVNAKDGMTLTVSASEITFRTTGPPSAVGIDGTVTLDGTQTVLWDSRIATAALDAGWLAVTTRRARNGGTTNVMREVYIALDNELTIWRTLHVEFADGTQGKIDCGNHAAIVYTRK